MEDVMCRLFSETASGLLNALERGEHCAQERAMVALRAFGPDAVGAAPKLLEISCSPETRMLPRVLSPAP